MFSPCQDQASHNFFMREKRKATLKFVYNPGCSFKHPGHDSLAIKDTRLLGANAEEHLWIARRDGQGEVQGRAVAGICLHGGPGGWREGWRSV